MWEREKLQPAETDKDCQATHNDWVKAEFFVFDEDKIRERCNNFVSKENMTELIVQLHPRRMKLSFMLQDWILCKKLIAIDYHFNHFYELTSNDDNRVEDSSHGFSCLLSTVCS